MDREQEELQFLGFFGIFRETIAIIGRTSKIFTKITLTLILPLSFVFLANIYLSLLLTSKIIHNEAALDAAAHQGSPSSYYDAVSSRISSEWTAFWLIKAAYLLFLLIFSLLSTSAVVYTVASSYTAKDITFPKVISVVPKVWKRLMVTFLCSFAVVFVYHLLLVPAVIISLVILDEDLTTTATVILVLLLVVLLVCYLVGLVYISVIWQLASVVTVLEDSCGMGAMLKSRALIKGKMWVAVGVLLVFNLCLGAVKLPFDELVVRGKGSGGIGGRVALGAVCLMGVCVIFLFGLVVQTVIYFVCKSYHHENVDKSALADHLEVYLGEYVPLKAKDIQLEQVYV
ncbi:hypothetical protein Dimus_013816 [Dionaea muscipula]